MIAIATVTGRTLALSCRLDALGEQRARRCRGRATVLMLAVLLPLSACQSTTSIHSGEFDMGGYQIGLLREWSQVPIEPEEKRRATLWSGMSTRSDSNRRMTMLTVDGPLLNKLYLVDDLAEGAALLGRSGTYGAPPTYRRNMSELELVEFVVATLTLTGYNDLVTREVRPATFDGEDGVAFGLSAKTAEGLNISGEALLAEDAGGLDLVLFLAPSEYYFAAFSADVHAVFASVGAEPP